MPPKSRGKNKQTVPVLSPQKHKNVKDTSQAEKISADSIRSLLQSNRHDSELVAPAANETSRYDFRPRRVQVGSATIQAQKQRRTDQTRLTRQTRQPEPKTLSNVQSQYTGSRRDKANTVSEWAKGVSNTDVPTTVENSSVSSALSASSASSISTISALARYYQAQGYRRPQREMQSTRDVSSQLSSGPPSQRRRGRPKKSKDGQQAPATITVKPSDASDFNLMLRNLNIDFQESKDPNAKLMNKLLQPRDDDQATEEEERYWQNDLKKCSVSDEAQFQRTIMMDMIDRHKLHETLDYVVESRWICAEVPRRDRDGVKVISPPMPDLAIAFKRRTILDYKNADMILGELRSRMCPEESTKQQHDRAFHFFSVEVKGVQGELGNTTAIRQNFNTSSQSLYNMWCFFQQAGEERMFFRDIRVFSAIATSAGFSIRVHWAERDDVFVLDESTPLSFNFQEIVSHNTGYYSRTEVIRVIKNILFEYGIKELLPKLQVVVRKVLKPLIEERTQKRLLQRQMMPPPSAHTSFNTVTTEHDLTQTALAGSFGNRSQASSNGSKKRDASALDDHMERSKRRVEGLTISNRS